MGIFAGHVVLKCIFRGQKINFLEIFGHLNTGRNINDVAFLPWQHA